jgi:hypothetical protein
MMLRYIHKRRANNNKGETKMSTQKQRIAKNVKALGWTEFTGEKVNGTYTVNGKKFRTLKAIEEYIKSAKEEQQETKVVSYEEFEQSRREYAEWKSAQTKAPRKVAKVASAASYML